ncbi:hypothetical protein ACDK62_10200 [Streptococcus dysgalactiae]|uniref:hypothetical protein n=1 Tax=Streptococcus dysgalactiae TaxID=1334 RepID=UPI0010C45465|nr:hypothetical protein [Streptococcus dysgalactiae]MBM6547380.1 hypothetical protein [Streptococcus dysgalactiae subsp. equisimilis]QBX14159.1 hypothetical protein Javan129_0008 [Streptococcus phage Javan129]QBX23495.1 hypothetical protein Javan132_0061 [Streptococcus phage Javan132]
MNETQNKFLELMQAVLNEIKTPENDYSAHTLNTCLSHLTEAYKDYLDILRHNSDKNRL